MEEKESEKNSQNEEKESEESVSSETESQSDTSKPAEENRKKTDDGYHSNHRQRMWDRIKRFGFESLEPHEQLEVILYNPISRGNTNETAHEIIKRFGSVYAALIADPKELMKIKGVGPKVAEYLNSLLYITGAVERFELKYNFGSTLDNIEKASKYAVSLFHGKAVEYLYIVSLNSFKKVISTDMVSAENASQVNTTVAYIAKLALSNHASYIMLAHNHPGGSLNPSPADMHMQRAVYEGLNTLSIKLEYNFIVAQGRAKCIFSREDGFGI